eukprot:871415-Ditylum_brightwellii.AAC.1
MSELTNQEKDKEIEEWHVSDSDNDFSDDESVSSKDEDNEDDVESSVKRNLQSVFQLLQVPNKDIINEISNRGNHNLSKHIRIQQQVYRIVNVINTALFDLLCEPSAAEKVKKDFYEKEYTKSHKNTTVVNNLLTLSFHGSKSTSIVAESVLATSFELTECKKLYKNAITSDPMQMGVPPMKKLIGYKKFTLLRKVFLAIKD